ncbi:MAG TPA: TonB-dependent receptor, partial [Chitinophagaceae bacterium]|nr:TonB-dependent receptor [Chitinophagaceae bacterium]
MKSRKLIFITFFLAFPVLTFCQEKFTISGYVKDSLSGETLIGSTISIAGKAKGIASNQFGFYSITLPAGTYSFICSYIGYVSQIRTIQLQKNVGYNFELMPKVTTEQTVVISSRSRDANVKNAQMGKIDLSMNQVKAIPAFLGEVDILKTIQLLPGVQSAGEGSSGLYVRGGGPDQNLILLDDAVVYNTGHLFGFFSIFNGDAIKSTSLIKGGMPAQYGGRLSSVLDIAMKEGNNKSFEMEGGIGLIASRLSVQGPVKKNKASFIVSARRTYVDALVKPFIKKTNSFYGSGYYFYDLNAKVNYKFSEKDHLYLSGYFGKDRFDFV